MTESDFMNSVQSYFERSNAKTQSKIEIIRPNGEIYEGEFKYEFIDNHVNRRTDTITFFLECQNDRMQLLPGGYVKVTLSEVFEKPLPAVSLTALMLDGEQQYVFIVTEENKIEKRNVTVGLQVFEKHAILSGFRDDGDARRHVSVESDRKIVGHLLLTRFVDAGRSDRENVDSHGGIFETVTG